MHGLPSLLDFCRFNALAYAGGRLLVFEEVCHSCGGCALLCPEKAIFENERTIGKISKGVYEDVSVITGVMNTGEVFGIPIIRKLFDSLSGCDEEAVFIDCPPGSACLAMECVKCSDYCVLVAEPTLFGAHNLAMVYELVRLFDKPFGVILNKCINGSDASEDFCFKKDVPILGRIPLEKELGALSSEGKIAVRCSDKYNEMFSSLLGKVMQGAPAQRRSTPVPETRRFPAALGGSRDRRMEPPIYGRLPQVFALSVNGRFK